MLGRLFGSRKQASSQPSNDKGKTSGRDESGSNRNNKSRNASRRRKSGVQSAGKPSSNTNSSSRANSSSKKFNQNQSSDNRSQQKSNQTSQRQAGHSSQEQAKQTANQHERWSLDEFKVDEQEGKKRFHDFDLPSELMHAIADLGFEYCSPIQGESLPHTLNGQDVIGKAQTGTGKTAAFLITIIEDLLRNPIQEQRYAGEARALVIAPTRELVLQIADDAKALTKYADLEVHTLVGGMDYGKQQRRLQDCMVDILVATPGRLLDFCGNRDVYLDQIEVMVIDEADRMLDMGFIPQVRRIVRLTPKKTHRQTLCFSATFTDDVMGLVDQWTLDPVTVDIAPESVATDTVTQHVYLSSGDEKYTLLHNLLLQDDVESLIVFANRRDQCRRLKDQLQAHGFKVGLLSGEIPQNKRVQTLDAFKTRKLKVLVATDVAGRGIHIDGISHVVNFTLPEEPEDYIHRIGRTGRAGKSGTSVSFACEDDAVLLLPIQDLVGEKLKCTQPPENLLAPVPEVKLPPATRERSSNRGRPNSRTGSRTNPNNRGNNRNPSRR